MEIHLAFFTSWAKESDALPLVLTGSDEALQEAVKIIKTSFTTADIYHVAPHGKTIPIKDIRAMRVTAGQSAWSGRRLVIISEAEKLSDAAAEALLKILEEPTRASRFVLTTQWYRRLRPTIRSRSQRVRLPYTIAVASTENSPPFPPSVLARFGAFAGDTPLDATTLKHVRRLLEQQLRQQGPTPALARAYLRLRDYHRITAEPSGNHKLARDVLLASLPAGV